MIQSSLRKCCSSTVKLHRILGSALTDGDCSMDLDFTQYSDSLCNVSRYSKKILKNSKQILGDVSYVGLIGNSDFFLSTSLDYKSINLSISFSAIQTVVGQLITGELQTTIGVNFEEDIINWLNFHNKPINTSFVSWETIPESWNFYSTLNNTTNTQILQNTTILTEYQNTVGSTTQLVLTVYLGDGKTLILNIDIDDSGVATLVSFDGSGIEFRTFYFEDTPQAYNVFIRDLLIYKYCSKLYLDFTTDMKYVQILNGSSTEDLLVDVFTATKCSEEELQACCC